jgi:uncharacterized RDD family membrane protein YckC
MSTDTPSVREQGIQALREGDLDRAIDLLTRTLNTGGRDAEVQMLLGVAYSQKGLHTQARRALQTAVELQPESAAFQFNLGVALERAGDVAAAVAAFRETLRLNPEHAQARTHLQAISSQVPAAPGAAPPPAGSSAQTAPAGASGLGSSPPPRTAPTAGPPGTVQCAKCSQWSRPGLTCEWCNASLRAAGGGPSAPWLQPAGGSAAAAVPVWESGLSLAPDMGAGEAFGRRFVASLIDNVAINLVTFPIGLFIGIFFGVAAGMSGQRGAVSGATTLAQLLSGGVGLLIGIIYYGGMLSWRGQTLGKMALGLRVVGPDGQNPSFWRAVLRETIGKFISGVVFALGYLWMLWDERQQTWHDKIAGTEVVRA